MLPHNGRVSTKSKVPKFPRNAFLFELVFLITNYVPEKFPTNTFSHFKGFFTKIFPQIRFRQLLSKQIPRPFCGPLFFPKGACPGPGGVPGPRPASISDDQRPCDRPPPTTPGTTSVRVPLWYPFPPTRPHSVCSVVGVVVVVVVVTVMVHRSGSRSKRLEPHADSLTKRVQSPLHSFLARRCFCVFPKSNNIPKPFYAIPPMSLSPIIYVDSLYFFPQRDLACVSFF